MPGMGLFKRDEHRLPGYAAMCRDDVEDARRRRPASDLADYARGRGLEDLDNRTAAGYCAALPDDPDLQHNVLRGVLPGGAHGIVFHYTMPWSAPGGSPSGNGTWYGTHYSQGF